MANVKASPLTLQLTGAVFVDGERTQGFRLEGPGDMNANGRPDVRLSLYSWPFGQVLDREVVDMPVEGFVHDFNALHKQVNSILPPFAKSLVEADPATIKRLLEQLL